MLISFLLAGASALSACPWLAEIFPDPTTQDDRLGEFIEVVIPESRTGNLDDSISLWLDADKIAQSPRPATGGRWVFCHTDSLRLLPGFSQNCEPLSGSLLNTRPLQISLSSKDCRDTAWLEPAVSGKSWQRANVPPENSLWVTSAPSPGFGQPGIEKGVRNASPAFSRITRKENRWEISLPISGYLKSNTHLDSLLLEWFDMENSKPFRMDTLEISADTLHQQGNLRDPPWILVRATLWGDEFPLDNKVSQILFTPGAPPLGIQEVNACPATGLPEWFEIRNQTNVPIPLHAISNCKGMEGGDSSLNLASEGIAVIADNAEKLLATFPGMQPQAILESEHALELSNVADTVRLCLWGQQIDSVIWGPTSPTPCSPTQPTPGWKPQNPSPLDAPHLNSRIVSRNLLRPLRLQVPSQDTSWRISIIHNSGQTLLRDQVTPGGIFTWNPPAHTQSGPCILVGTWGSTTWRSTFVIVE